VCLGELFSAPGTVDAIILVDERFVAPRMRCHEQAKMSPEGAMIFV